MKTTPALCDEDNLVCVLRWRRPQLLSATACGVICALLCTTVGLVLPDALAWIAHTLAVGCLGVAAFYFLQLRRVARRLEELER